MTVKNNQTKIKKKVAEVEDPPEHLATSSNTVQLDGEVEEEEGSVVSSPPPCLHCNLCDHVVYDCIELSPYNQH